MLNNPAQVKQMTETNLQVASKHFSYETAKSVLERIIKALHGKACSIMTDKNNESIRNYLILLYGDDVGGFNFSPFKSTT